MQFHTLQNAQLDTFESSLKLYKINDPVINFQINRSKTSSARPIHVHVNNKSNWNVSFASNDLIFDDEFNVKNNFNMTYSPYSGINALDTNFQQFAENTILSILQSVLSSEKKINPVDNFYESQSTFNFGINDEYTAFASYFHKEKTLCVVANISITNYFTHFIKAYSETSLLAKLFRFEGNSKKWHEDKYYICEYYKDLEPDKVSTELSALKARLDTVFIEFKFQIDALTVYSKID